MKTLFIDCSMGCAGDMLTASLLELLENKEDFVNKLNSIGLEGVNFSLEKMVKCGITGSHMNVLCNGEEEGEEHHHEHEHHHHHSSLADISHIVNGHLHVSDKVKKQVMDIYGLIAQAESKVHGVPVTEIHFHEVGTLDAIADITAVCMLFEELGAEKIIASPVHAGSGTVQCAHGILPVPAPATALLLTDIPFYSADIKGELCTPTGAALLKYFVTEFREMPLMKISKIGYGMGKKDFSRVNCVRTFLGETQGSSDDVIQLSFNIDDMDAEKIAFAQSRFFENGALDVFTTSVGMKKNRMGTLIQVLCKESEKEKLVNSIFQNTTTIGIREQYMHRYVLDRKIETLDTSFGPVNIKRVSGYGTSRCKIEYDDLSKIAVETGLSIKEIEDKIKDQLNK